MKVILVAMLWIAAYLLAVCAPLLLLLSRPLPPGTGLWWDFSMAIGFAAIAMLGVQFVLTARFRRLTSPFGIDIVYYFHRYMAVFAFVLVLAHYGVLRVVHPQSLGSADPLVAPAHMSAGRLALLCFALLVISSLLRKRLHIRYEAWRISHVVLSIAGLVAAVMHIHGVDYYSHAPLYAAFWKAFLAFWLLVLLYVRLIKPIRMLGRPYRVIEVRRETGRTSTVVLRPDGHRGMPFMPGQFAWLTLRASPFALREHPFSIASAASHADRLEFTIKSLGDFTRTIAAIRPGELAYLDGPYGVFSVDRVDPHRAMVFIAGGVGIAPVMSMLRTLADRGDRRNLLLVYANRSTDGIIFRDELEALRQRLSLRIVHVLQEPSPGLEHESGLLSRSLLEKLLPAERRDLHYFICGPTPLLRIAESALHELQVPLRRVHSEIFDLV